MGTAAAPRLDRRLVQLIKRTSNETPAEVTREVGRAAERLGLFRPSYEQVRVIRLSALAVPGEAASIELRITLDLSLRPRPPRGPRWYVRLLEKFVTVCYVRRGRARLPGTG
jgi:hypothetical protein